MRQAIYIFVCYLLGLAAGASFGRRRPAYVASLRAARLRAFGHWPLRSVGKALVGGRLATTAGAMTAVNLAGAAAHLVAGASGASPALAAGQGFLVGSLLAGVRSPKAYLFSAAVLPFEVGAFAVAGALGRDLARRQGEEGSGAGLPRAGVARRLALCVALQSLGGVVEAAGAVRLRLPGVLSYEEIAEAVADKRR